MLFGNLGARSLCMRKDVATTFNVFRAAYFLTLLYTFPLFRMSDAEKPILTPAEEHSLADENMVSPAETPEAIPVPDGAASPAEGATATEGTPQKPWYQFWGGKRKSRKQSRKQKGGKKSKSRGGNKKSRKQKRSAKNKRA